MQNTKHRHKRTELDRSKCFTVAVRLGFNGLLVEWIRPSQPWFSLYRFVIKRDSTQVYSISFRGKRRKFINRFFTIIRGFDVLSKLFENLCYLYDYLTRVTSSRNAIKTVACLLWLFSQHWKNHFKDVPPDLLSKCAVISP